MRKSDIGIYGFGVMRQKLRIILTTINSERLFSILNYPEKKRK